MVSGKISFSLTRREGSPAHWIFMPRRFRFAFFRPVESQRGVSHPFLFAVPSRLPSSGFFPLRRAFAPPLNSCLLWARPACLHRRQNCVHIEASCTRKKARPCSKRKNSGGSFWRVKRLKVPAVCSRLADRVDHQRLARYCQRATHVTAKEPLPSLPKSHFLVCQRATS